MHCHHQASSTRSTHKTNSQVRILKSQRELDPIATPSSSSLLHHSLFAPFHLIEPPHPAKLPPFTSTLYGHHQQKSNRRFETVPGDWCKTRADKSPPNRSNSQGGEEGRGLVSNHGDLNRISFNPVHNHHENRKAHSSYFLHFIQRPRRSVYPSLFFFSFFFFFFSTVCHIFISRGHVCRCVPPFRPRGFSNQVGLSFARRADGNEAGEIRNTGEILERYVRSSCFSNGNSDYQSGGIAWNSSLRRGGFFLVQRNLK